MEFFLDKEIQGLRELPWYYPLIQWESLCKNIQEVPKGASHHPIIFVNLNGEVYALKEMPENKAEYEFHALKQLSSRRIPTVSPVGFVRLGGIKHSKSILISNFLDYSLPYSMLFASPDLERYKEALLDAIAGLLVQLHLSGIYWGDCSLANTLFRRDAGALQAYLVDAESVQIQSEKVSPEYRSQDLERMSDNINRELLNSLTTKLFTKDIPIFETTSYIRLQYQKLWEEVTKEDIIPQDEQYRIQDRVRAINKLGFSVGSIELTETKGGANVKFRVIVIDRNFYHDQLLSLTGIEAQEKQAEKIINEINEIRASFSSVQSLGIPMSVAAYHWSENYYQPIISRLGLSMATKNDPVELYCQVLEHKWFLSEMEKRDVGHEVAADDYIRKMGNSNE